MAEIPDGKVAVKEIATGKISRVWPVDAREILGGRDDDGEPFYEAVDDAAAALAAHEAAFPLSGKGRKTVESKDEGKAKGKK